MVCVNQCNYFRMETKIGLKRKNGNLWTASGSLFFFIHLFLLLPLSIVCERDLLWPNINSVIHVEIKFSFQLT